MSATHKRDQATSLHTVRDAGRSLLWLSAIEFAGSALLLWYFSSSSEFSGRGLWSGTLLGAVLELSGAVAAWVVPLYVTVLVAALAVLVIPDWQRRHDEAVTTESEDELASVRRLIGRTAMWVGPAYVVWAAWVIVALCWPGVPGGQNVGVLIALPVVLTLTLLVSRAALGTLAQRVADAASALDGARAWRYRVRALSYLQRASAQGNAAKAARWPVVIVAVVILAGATGAFAGFARIDVGLAWAAAVLTLFLEGLAAASWASRYREQDGVTRKIFAVSTVVLLLILFGGMGSVSMQMGLWTPTLAAVLPAGVVLLRWRGKQLLAGTALRRLDERVVELEQKQLELASVTSAELPQPSRPNWRAGWFRFGVRDKVKNNSLPARPEPAG